jgi:hypothetical protein
MRKTIYVIFALLCSAFGTMAQVPVSLGPMPRATFFSATGPLANGYVCTYAAGPSTPQATYTDSTGLVANSNPVILDANGSASIWFTASGYKIVIRQPGGDGTCGAGGGTVISTTDNFLIGPFLAANNAWTGNQTFAGTSTFNGAVAFNAGGSLTGSFTGSPTFSGNPTFSGTPIFSHTGVIFTNPVLNGGTGSFTGSVLSAFVNAAGGTGINLVAKLTGAPSTAITTLSTDQTGAIGICTTSCTTIGNSLITTVGQASCVFDGATTAGDYVTLSATTAGNCHDVGGGGYPTSGQVLGRSLSTNGGGGTYTMILFGAEDRTVASSMPFPNVVYNTASSSTNANIGATTMVTVGGSGATYRLSFYLQLSVVGASCVGATSVTLNLIFQDPLAAGTVTNASVQNLTTSAAYNGVLGAAFGNNSWTSYSDSIVFRAKTATNIQYSTTYAIGSSCSPGPQYVLFPILEQLTAN